VQSGQRFWFLVSFAGNIGVSGFSTFAQGKVVHPASGNDGDGRITNWICSNAGSGCREILRKSGPNLPLDTQDVTKTEKNRLFGQVFGQGSNHFKTKSRFISARVQEIKLSSIISVNSRNLLSEWKSRTALFWSFRLLERKRENALYGIGVKISTLLLHHLCFGHLLLALMAHWWPSSNPKQPGSYSEVWRLQLVALRSITARQPERAALSKCGVVWK
jgi:hypothetical protein